MNSERWLTSSFSPRYEVSDQGRVRRDGVVIRPNLNPRTGYLQVSMIDSGRRATKPVHRLVGEAFLGARPDGLETRHLNGERFDNRAANLAYGTHSDNMLDQVRHGSHAMAARTHCPSGHAFDEANTLYPTKGGRRCRACQYLQTIKGNERAKARRIASGWDPDAYRNRGANGVRKPPPPECGNGHDLTGDNLRIVVGPASGGTWVCRTCEKAAKDRYLARRRGVALPFPSLDAEQERAA